MNLERLQHQIDILQKVAVAEKKFDMSQWLDVNTHGCGSSACAFGYACLDPYFQAQGLRLEFEHRYPNEDIGEARRLTIASVADFNLVRNRPGRFDPVFGDYSSFDAAAEIYDITLLAASFLFDPDTYVREGEPIAPEDVIGRVMVVIDRGGDVSEDDFVLHDDDEEDC
jgi:hypothetical protein